jgi:type II secretory pathway component GspD/PulD (secretin)
MIMIFCPDLAEAMAEENSPQPPAYSKMQQQQEKETLKTKMVIAEDRLKTKEVIVRTFRIRNLDINEVKNKIRSLLTKDEKIAASVEAFTFQRSGKEVNFLLVRDTPLKIEQIEALIQKLEQEFTLTTVNLNFSDVSLSRILATIASIADLDIVGGEALSEKVSIHLTNVPLEDALATILKSTGYSYIKDGKVIRIIPRQEAPLVTEVFELQFVSAEQIEQAVSHLLSGEGKIKTFSKLSEEGYANYLIVTDKAESLESISTLINKLDKKVGQVMIEVKFCELTLDKDTELGIEWIIQPSISGADVPTQFPTTTLGLRRLERPAVIEETSGEITLGTISFSDFTATLRALDTDTEVNLIASPRIATKEGEEAEIVIGDRVPIPLYERNEETGTIEITGYQDEEIGVVLKVTPIINNDNTITLKIHPEVSEITGYTGPNNERPVVSTREISTVFTVENGKTVVLGGLMKQTLRNSLRKVPLLGNIPVFGALFRFQDDSEDKTELLVFITPHIIEKSIQQKEAISENGVER